MLIAGDAPLNRQTWPCRGPPAHRRSCACALNRESGPERPAARTCGSHACTCILTSWQTQGASWPRSQQSSSAYHAGHAHASHAHSWAAESSAACYVWAERNAASFAPYRAPPRELLARPRARQTAPQQGARFGRRRACVRAAGEVLRGSGLAPAAGKRHEREQLAHDEAANGRRTRGSGRTFASSTQICGKPHCCALLRGRVWWCRARPSDPHNFTRDRWGWWRRRPSRARAPRRRGLSRTRRGEVTSVLRPKALPRS